MQPDEQEKFTIDNYQFEILQKKHHQIKFAKFHQAFE
jgi:Mg2+/Co2+ transporter CorB